MGKALRMLGLATTEKEINDAVKEIDESNDGVVHWSEFLHFMAKKLTDASVLNTEIDMAFEGAWRFEAPSPADAAAAPALLSLPLGVPVPLPTPSLL